MGFEMRKKGKVMKAEEFAAKMKEIQEEAQAALRKAQEEMKKQADWHREEVEEYKVGDMVLLSTRDLKWQMIRRKTDKLTERFVGPYRVKGIISSNTIELELSSSVRIHLVVNISRIRRYRDQVRRRKVTPPPPVEIQGEIEYEVEKILSKRKRYRKVEYLVRWKSYTAKEDTWEKEGNLGNARRVVEYYEKEYEKMARRIREEEDGAYNRSELPGRYTTKVLYGWDDRRFEKEYLEKLERNWRKWKGGKFFQRKNLKRGSNVMNRLDPIEELYDMYLEEEDTPRIVELVDDGLDFDSGVEGLADPYMDL